MLQLLANKMSRKSEQTSRYKTSTTGNKQASISQRPIEDKGKLTEEVIFRWENLIFYPLANRSY
jgi:hypothetical protein